MGQGTNYATYRPPNIIEPPIIDRSSHVDGKRVFDDSKGLETNIKYVIFAESAVRIGVYYDHTLPVAGR